MTSEELLQKYFIVLEKLLVLLERQNGELLGKLKLLTAEYEKLKSSSATKEEDK